MFFKNLPVFQFVLRHVLVAFTINCLSGLSALGMAYESIEILPVHSPSLKKQVPEESDHQDTSSYNKCYGRGMVFKVLPPFDLDSWQRKASGYMRKFFEVFEGVSKSPNCVIASFCFRWFKDEEHNIRYTLPYLFFSGEREKVSSRIFFTQQEVFEAKIPAYVKGEVEKYLLKFTLEGIVRDCFPKEFFACPYQGPLFVLQSHNDPNDLKQPALDFRQFIYSHFVDEVGYQEFRARNPNLPFIHIVNNLIGYTHGCTSEEYRDHRLFLGHERILELALLESYLRQVKAESLLSVFGEENVDDLFNQGSHDRSDHEKGMSYCFHHSEQALLRYLLEGDIKNKKFHNEFISRLIEFLKFRLSLGDHLERLNYSIINNSEEPFLKPETADEVPSLEQIQMLASRKSTQPKKEKTHDVQEVIVQIEDDISIDMDIISFRDICKYCRGTLYFGRTKIFELLKDHLVEKGIVFYKGQKWYDELTTFFKSVLETAPRSIRLKFLKLEFNIVATSLGIALSPHLAGKMEIENE